MRSRAETARSGGLGGWVQGGCWFKGFIDAEAKNAIGCLNRCEFAALVGFDAGNRRWFPRLPRNWCVHCALSDGCSIPSFRSSRDMHSPGADSPCPSLSPFIASNAGARSKQQRLLTFLCGSTTSSLITGRCFPVRSHPSAALKQFRDGARALPSCLLLLRCFQKLSTGVKLPRGQHWQWLHDIAAFLLPIALPLAAGIATALQAALDSGRRSRTYHEMIERLESFELAIAAVKTNPRCGAPFIKSSGAP